MYTHSHTTPRAALCIISILLFITLAKATNSSECYNPINNGDLSTTFYVEASTPYNAPYACQLSADNINYNAPDYTLTVGGTPDAITCAEMFTIDYVSYGYYECEMQPPGIAGTVTSCMVESSARTDYESVYIKFIGNDTKRVYIGYYADGVSYPAGPQALKMNDGTPFDASAQPVKYAFEWTSGYIKWYVDNKIVSSADGGHPLPSLPNRLYANLLTEQAGVLTDDSNIYTDSTVDRVFSTDGTISATATFTNISYTPVIFINCDNTTGLTPGNSGYVPYDPNACDLRTPFTIYGDALAKGWTTQNSTLSNVADTSSPRSGTYVISWSDNPLVNPVFNPILNIMAPTAFATTEYDNFEFWINGNGVFGQQIGVNMKYDDGSNSEVVNIASLLTEGIQQAEWSRVVIPFSAFGVSVTTTTNVLGFAFTSLSTTAGGSVLFDDMLLGYASPMCENTTKVIYAEGLAKGFTDSESSPGESWIIESNLIAHGGSYSVQINMPQRSSSFQYQYLYFRVKYNSNIDTNTYQGISFWIDISALSNWDWTFTMTSQYSTDPTSLTGVPMNLYKYYGGVLPQQVGNWIHIVIPFSEFGIAPGSSLNGFVLQQSNIYQDQGTIFLDDISFIGEVAGGGESTSGASSLGAGLLSFLFVALLM